MRHNQPLLRLLALLLLAALPRLASAQRVLLRADPATDTIPGRYGPNRAFYQHLYLGYTAVTGAAAGPGAKLRYPQSAELFAGLRNKWRVTGSTAVGLDARFAYLRYQLQQNSTKQVPNSQLHYRESLNLTQLQLEPFARLSFGRRGNVVGNYLDVSAWGGWALASNHSYEDRPGQGQGTRTLVREVRPAYLRRWNWGLSTRLGAGRYALLARYRLADTFSASAPAAYPELPRWLLGLEVGIF
ncbi:hypothetical protein [Hymenobacter psychrophilus]|uniref:Outer membrane protein beta-barrel domain-containing protein n=1 Tax=Hymenobacter psychrophilus TaxID=651662 RepID=A0A1H3CTW7_9BACT|nr:hypothetical protein [Hymenobacter psychrophilus]SDX57611.1 hypothetical protein SAMN04488069_102113 [Hymenobacter psychrophilus]